MATRSASPQEDEIEVDVQTRAICGLPDVTKISLAFLIEHIHRDDWPEVEAALQRMRSATNRQTCTGEFRYVHADGMERWIAWSARTLVDDSDERGRILGTLRDITESKHRELRWLADKRQKDEALANLAHDLRNPLAAIQSAVRLWSRADGNPDIARMATKGLQEQIKKMTDIVHQLLETAPSSALTAVKPAHVEAAADIAGTVHPTPETETTTAELVSDGPGTELKKTKRVLIADDNDDAAATLAMLLRLEGHKVITAHDGQDALEKAETSHPDVLLLDIGMPVKNGLEVAKEVRARPWSAACKLIAVSGRGRAEDQDLSRAAGFHAHLTKPLDIDALSQLLRN